MVKKDKKRSQKDKNSKIEKEDLKKATGGNRLSTADVEEISETPFSKAAVDKDLPPSINIAKTRK